MTEIMVTLQAPDSSEQVRVFKADDYPAYPGWTVIVEEQWPTLAMLKDDKKAAVTALKMSKQDGIVPTTIGAVQNDDRSKILINGAFNMASMAKAAGQAFSVNWTLADNSVADLDADAMIGMALQVGGYIAAVQDRSNALRALIEAAADQAALDAIDLTAGWPSQT